MAEPAPDPNAPKKLSAKEERILARQKAEAEKKGKQVADKGGDKEAAKDDTPLAGCNELFGVLPLNQSQNRPGKKYTRLEELTPALAKQTVIVRGRVHASRPAGNLCFLVLRQKLSTVQVIVAKGDTSKEFVNFSHKISKESMVEVEGIVSIPEKEVSSTTQKNVELSVRRLHVLSIAATPLPLQIEDASRPQPVLDAQENEIKAIEAQIAAAQAKLGSGTEAEKKALEEELTKLAAKKSEALRFPSVGLDHRLNNRVIDLRTQTNHAIFRIQAGVGFLFREYLEKNGFLEIHSPKMIGAASEGGANVFQIKYFDGSAYLAQSPQFAKQMMICSDYERVYEIGPVFRAENANTHRHMTEFIGLDLEMQIQEHYHEVLEMMDGLFLHIFDGIAARYARELDIVNVQFPFTPIKYSKPTLRITFAEGNKLLADAGRNLPPLEDLSTPDEKLLGKLVKEKYGVDFYILDKFPAAARPFYTMPDPTDARYTNSYDLFVRGEEIVSGSQRVHDAAMLETAAKARGVTISQIQPYIDAFKYGAPPHGGCGIGLERVVLFYLGLGNIRKACLFPRDPTRLAP
jgi:aspartyl-tRNA synthetase